MMPEICSKMIKGRQGHCHWATGSDFIRLFILGLLCLEFPAVEGVSGLIHFIPQSTLLIGFIHTPFEVGAYSTHPKSSVSKANI